MTAVETTINAAIPATTRANGSFLLYGSYARGDFDSTSDIDVLRITTSRENKQQLGDRVSLHTYDIKDLLAMAQQGSLFILHLMKEAKPLHDADETIGQLSAAFRGSRSYTTDARHSLLAASALLDVDESLFESAPQSFLSATTFMGRTLVYAEHADRGPFSFSMRALAKTDETASMICNINRESTSYSDFQRLRRAVQNRLPSSGSYGHASSLEELKLRSNGDPLYEGLLKRIVKGLKGSVYAHR